MSCQCGCGRMIHLVEDGRGLPRQWDPETDAWPKLSVPVMPAPRIAGKPHICRWWNQWIVASDPAAPVDEKWLAAVRHAEHLDATT